MAFGATALAAACAHGAPPSSTNTPEKADDERLQIWVTRALAAADLSQCHRQPAQPLPETRPTLNAADIRLWVPESASMQLDRYPGLTRDLQWRLQDHCFVMAVDGQFLAAGVILSSNSARLSEQPTLELHAGNGALALQLLGGNSGAIRSPAHVQALQSVFAHRANLQYHLAVVKALVANGAFVDTHNGAQWSAAVRHLMDTHKIASGMSLGDLIAQVGPPTSSVPPPTDAAALSDEPRPTRYHWYLNTPRHVNPMLTAWETGGVVTHVQLSSF